MVVTLTDDQLPDLLESLQENQQAMHIRGEIKSKLSSLIMDYDFIVDSWPDYKALVVRVNPIRAKYLNHLGKYVTVYALDTETLETLLQKPGVIDWTSNKSFIFEDNHTLPALLKVTDEQQTSIKNIWRLHIMMVTKITLKLWPIPEGFKITRLQPQQANLVNSLWKYNEGEHSEMYIKDIVTKLPSCCLYNKEGEVVGFALRYHYGFIGMLHVLKEHRRKGYGKVIMSHLANSCLQTDKEIVVNVEVENIASTKLHESIGFENATDSIYFW